MSPLRLLTCLANALLRHAGNAVGFGLAGDVLVNVGAEVWAEWTREQDERQRRDELAALVGMAAQEVRRQVEEVVRQVAADRPEAQRRQLADRLEEIPSRLRRSLG